MEELRNCWCEARFRHDPNVNPDNRRRTALAALADHYRRFSNIALILALCMPLWMWGIFRHGNGMNLWLSMGIVLFGMSYMLTVCVMDGGRRRVHGHTSAAGCRIHSGIGLVAFVRHVDYTRHGLRRAGGPLCGRDAIPQIHVGVSRDHGVILTRDSCAFRGIYEYNSRNHPDARLGSWRWHTHVANASPLPATGDSRPPR